MSKIPFIVDFTQYTIWQHIYSIYICNHRWFLPVIQSLEILLINPYPFW